LTPHIGAGGGNLRRGLATARLIYFAFFAAIGCLSPFLNIYFARQGLTGAEIGWLSSIPPLVALAANPLWGAIADRWHVHRLALAACAFGAGLVSLLLLVAGGFWPLMGVVVLLSFFRTPIGSLVDSAVMDMVRQIGAHYGRQRMWGSLGFVLVTFGLGRVISSETIQIAFWLHGVLLGVVVAWLGLQLPIAQREGQVSLWDGLRQLAGRRSYIAFLAAMVLLGIGTSGYVNFMGLHVLTLGGTERTVGLAWAVNAMAEIPIMFLGGRWFGRFSYGRLIQIAFAGYLVVWLLLMRVQAPWQMVVCAYLVGSCYGTVWVAAVNYAAQAAPPGLSATAQALVGAANAGIGWGIGSVVAGYLWDARGGSAVFLAAAVAALLGGLLIAWGNRQEPVAV
jgi:PPP family 3-phenylpropionic acid transporter